MENSRGVLEGTGLPLEFQSIPTNGSGDPGKFVSCNNSGYLGKRSGVQFGGPWGVLGNSGGKSLGRALQGSKGIFTLSILVAPGRFLGFLVRVTLTKLWKAADLGRKKPSSGVRRPETLPSDPQSWPCPPRSLALSYHLPFSFSLGGW